GPRGCAPRGPRPGSPRAPGATACCERKLERVWQRFIAQPALAVALERGAQPKDKKRLALTSHEA
ncbi:hypothetical protein C9F07_09055, partial [Salmonella enterica subsp. enterica serovar Poona]